MLHAYFYSLPLNTQFIHKGKRYIKIGEELVKDLDEKEYLFESHYGCLVSEALKDTVTARLSD